MRVKLSWNFDPSKFKVDPPLAKAEVGEKSFIGDIRRMGTALQRAFIVQSYSCSPRVSRKRRPRSLGFEEPEVYQHPPPGQTLGRSFLKIWKTPKVILTTHSPYFVSGKGVENIRLVRWKMRRIVPRFRI